MTLFLLRLENVLPFGSLQFAGVDGHRHHTVVANHPRQLDELVCPKAFLHRLKGHVVNSVRLQELPGKSHNLSVFRRHITGVFFPNRADR